MKKLFVVLGAVILLVVVAGAAGAAYLRSLRPAPAADPVRTADQATLRTLASGPVVGYVDESGAHAWLGIPYAAAPVGDLRWRPPRPPTPWKAPREALKTAPFCVQYASILTTGTAAQPGATPLGQEDCLYLNVWAPAFAPDAVPTREQALPVMLWIHGGGNSIGHAGNNDGAKLAASQNVVVVNFNYRLGPMGWFRHPALRGAASAAAAVDDGELGVADGGLDTADAGAVDGDPLDAGAAALATAGDPLDAAITASDAGAAEVVAEPAPAQTAPNAAARAEASGNFGTLDILFALSWVHENAARFGGDPENITVFGESAGGTNTMTMLASPLARGRFHRAIVQSGGYRPVEPARAENFSDADPSGHEHSSREIVDKLLVSDDTASNAAEARRLQRTMPPGELAEYLREKSAEDLYAAYGPGFGGMIHMPELFADGYVLPAETDPRKLFGTPGGFAPVPVILGTNRDEEKLFIASDPRFVKRLFGIFPRFVDEDAYERHSRYLTDVRKARTVDGFARLMIGAGHADVYAYRFDWDEEGSVLGFDLSKAFGAAHGLEVAFVFGQFVTRSLAADRFYDAARVPARDALSQAMMSYWAEHAYTGAPGQGRSGDLPSWSRWGEGGKSMIVLDTEEGGGIRMSSEVLTPADVKQRLLEDTTFEHQEDHCRMYLRMFEGSFEFDRAELDGLGKSGCKGFARDAD